MQSAIICTRHTDITDLTRKVLKGLGVNEVFSFLDAEACSEKLKINEEAILMLDWGIGEQAAADLLADQQTVHPAGIRPIFLFARKEQQYLNGVAMEYGVMQVHSGELSRDVIEARIKPLLSTQSHTKVIRDALKVCANARKLSDLKTEINTLQKLVDSQVKDDFVSCELAEALFRNGEITRALNLLKPKMGPQQKNPRVLNIYGRCLLRQGDFEQATVFLQQADLVNPFQLERLLQLGEAYLQLDRAARAEGKFRRALALDPENSEATQGVGKSLLLMGDVNEALVFLKQISAASEMASVFNTAAVICIRNGRTEEGLKLYRIACKTIGDADPSILAKLALNMGLAYHRHRDQRSALYYFEIAAALDSKFVRAKAGVQNLQKKVTSSDRISIGTDLFTSLLSENFTAIQPIDLSEADEDMRSDKASDYVDEF